MDNSKEILNKLIDLEDQRLALSKKSNKLMPWLIFFPFLVLIGSFMLFQVIQGAFIATVLAAIISFMIYHYNIQSNFDELKGTVRSSLLDEFMSIYHPDVKYTFYPEKQNASTIIINSRLISADEYNEEDVIRGTYKNAKFYLSEVHLKNKSKNNSHTVFKGILLKLRIPGKSFPSSQIQSKPGFLSRLFGGFQQDKTYGFWYDSSDTERFFEEMDMLFPFISHLTNFEGKDIRIKIIRDEIILMLESDMEFLDNPKPDLNRTFLNETYYENMGRQLNSLLFIVESFVNNLDKSEIEERLQLRMLDFAKLSEINRPDKKA